MKLIDEESIIREYQSELMQSIIQNYQRKYRKYISVTASKQELEIYSNEHDNRFYGYEEIKNRHLNVFGVYKADTFIPQFQLSIPISGVNKSLQGLFFIDNKNRICIGYRGLITGVTGLNKDYFFRKTSFDIVEVGEASVIKICELEGQNILEKFFDYIVDVERIKETFRIEKL